MNAKKIAIIGLGYVGLPLALEFGKKRKVIGFDVDKLRVEELKRSFDRNGEVNTSEFKDSSFLFFTTETNLLAECDIYIITVPTPIDETKKPDLNSIKMASRLVGSVLKKNDIVIYESTVFPGATEEICVPLLEEQSNLIFNEHFFCGYSPERINPGDKFRDITSIVKVTSGSTPEIAEEIDELYKEIVIAGTHKAPSIRVAEAAKIIENTQRDLNIALINEFSLILNKLKIDTNSVLEAAKTKWNFMPFKPGLVGGHCIGVDPYYLAFKALESGHTPDVVLAGRKVNDKMPIRVAENVFEIMVDKKIEISGANILILGFAFKENCRDLRNTGVNLLYKEFIRSKCSVEIYDPYVDKKLAASEYSINLLDYPAINKYDAIVCAVGHNSFKEFSSSDLREFGKNNHVVYDISGILNDDAVDGRI